MEYHDNIVKLSLSGGYSITNGSYTLESFSVTGGQDPDGEIHSGLVASFGDNGEMSFRVGRKGSDEVANWFNNQIPASQTTFNHTADKLNFAFLGTLEMTITGGILGSGQATVTFAKVALAQGHSGASNNWWFGGQNCTYIQNNQVSCQGVNAKGAPVLFVFLRGGNDVSTVEITHASLVDTVNWMGGIDDSRTLDQLVMPGSHDTGMSQLSHCAPPVGTEPYTKTQSGSMEDQLVSGARYFDIRVDYDYDELVTYHRTDGWGCNGLSLTDVLEQTKAFLTAHTTETAILKFSHIRDYDRHDPASTKQRINDLLNTYSGLLYTNTQADINLAKVRLGDTRGKMILVFDYSEFITPSAGRFRYQDSDTAPSGSTNIVVFDEYSNTDNYDTMKEDQLAKWNAHGGLDMGYFFLLSWTLTATSVSSPSIQNLANEANSNLPGVLYDQILGSGISKPNIVYVDFVDSTVCQSIILYNFA